MKSFTIVASRGRWSNERWVQQYESNTDGVSNTITGVQKDNLVLEHVCTTCQERTVIEKDNLIVDMATQEKKKCPGVYGFYEMEPDEKALANKPKGRGWRYVMTEKGPAWVRIRKLTPRECFRLMDVDEDKIDKLLNAGISDSRLYQLAGNSIVVSCMEGIFYNAFCEDADDQMVGQLSLF